MKRSSWGDPAKPARPTVGTPPGEATAKSEDAVTTGTDSSQKRSADDRDARNDRAARFDSEHNDIEVVLDATKEQLEAAPEFIWLDDKRTGSASDERARALK